MVFIVLRHGETHWNRQNIFTGLSDISLNENGIMEAHNTKELLAKYTFHRVFTSNLKRTIETANIITKSYKFYTSTTVNASEFNERDYGDLTGKNKDAIKSKYGEELFHKFRRSYLTAPPLGENLDDVKLRVGTYFDKNILPILQRNDNVLIVAHGNSLRALFVHLNLKTPDNIENFEISTGVPIHIDIEKSKFWYENNYKLVGSQILDSRGFPTIEVQCFDHKLNKFIGKGSSPSGASCGINEVLELRDGDLNCYKGKSVYNAINNISLINEQMILNVKNITDLKKCDLQLNAIDNTNLKTILGGNTTTAVSFCLADTASKLLNMELFEYISKMYNFDNNYKIPTPFVNIINGGKHSITGDLKIQEFMIFPKEDITITEKIQMICEIYYTLQKILVQKYGPQAKSIGDEGGFCPPIYNTEEALQVIQEAILAANYVPNEDVFLALDCAASEFYDKNTKLYEIEKDMFLNKTELIDYYENIMSKYPALKSIEDGFDETDYEAWSEFTNRNSKQIMIVGDDLFTTNKKLISQGLENNWANTLLLKVNQIGTISEAIESASLMFAENNNVIVSHRSGETNHAYIIDLAVGIGAKYVKIGSPCRGERVAKFNRLLEIEQYLKYTYIYKVGVSS